MAAIKSNDQIRVLINQNFIIRVTDRHKKFTRLCGAGQYSKILENEHLKTKHFNKVLEGGLDKYTFLLRRGLKIEFLSK